MKLKHHQTIGAKLILAFSCCTLLLAVVAVVAGSTWHQLDNQVARLLDTSVPKYNASYQLESRSSDIRRRVQRLRTITSKVELEEQSRKLDEQLARVRATLPDKAPDSSSPEEDIIRLKEAYQLLAQQVAHYSQDVLKRIDLKRQRNLVVEQLDWLHQDIRSELIPLRQEYHWQTERAQDSQQVEAALSRLNNIQAILDLESTLYELTLSVMESQTFSQLTNGMKVVQIRLKTLSTLSKPLYSNPTSVAYRQLLAELNSLLSPEGQFQKLTQDVLLHNQLIQTKQVSIEDQLQTIHQKIAVLVADADNQFLQIKNQTTRLTQYGNQVLLACFILSILISLFLTYYFVNKRIVGRLNNLSRSIDAIINNDLSQPIRIDGNDEIGRLSGKLIEYGNKVREVQRTNALNLINNTTASLITCDLSGNVESANLSARNRLGLDDMTVARLIWHCFPSGSQDQIEALFTADSELLSQRRAEATLSTEAGSEPCYLHCDFRLFTQGLHDKVIVTITDITQQELANRLLELRVQQKTADLVQKNQHLEEEIRERERAEAHLQATQNELIQAAKMAVVGQTMTSLAHELNQPLNAMSSYIYSARLVCEQDPGKTRESLDHIDNLMLRMGKIINSMKNFARKTDVQARPEAVELTEVIENALTIVNTRARREQIQLQSYIYTPVWLSANAVSLEQILINLLVNSCDALQEKDRTEEKWVAVELLNYTDNRVTFTVSDSGNGFDEHIIHQLFTPFTTSKEIGLGLGLSICRSLMERYSGNIYLASNLTGGALVVLELPYESH